MHVVQCQDQGSLATQAVLEGGDHFGDRNGAAVFLGQQLGIDAGLEVVEGFVELIGGDVQDSVNFWIFGKLVCVCGERTTYRYSLLQFVAENAHGELDDFVGKSWHIQEVRLFVTHRRGVLQVRSC